MTTKSASWLRDDPEGVIITIFVQPRSSKNMVMGVHGDALKIKLTAPPVDGAANKMCIQFLAKTLKCSKSSLELRSGHTSRTKQVILKFDPKVDPCAQRQAFHRLIKEKFGQI